MARGKKPGTNQPDYKSKIHVRVDCEHCHSWDVVSDFEKTIHKRSFTQDYRECPKCHTVYCGTCLSHDKCPECDSKTINLTPEEVFVCAYCMEEWGADGGLCGHHCKYHKHK